VPKRGVEKTDFARATGARTIAFNVVTTARCTSSGIPSTAGSQRIEMPSAIPGIDAATEHPSLGTRVVQDVRIVDERGEVGGDPVRAPVRAGPRDDGVDVRRIGHAAPARTLTPRAEGQQPLHRVGDRADADFVVAVAHADPQGAPRAGSSKRRAALA
jgi:hypothetical protein